jgi:SAM-dependent methyltransferase
MAAGEHQPPFPLAARLCAFFAEEPEELPGYWLEGDSLAPFVVTPMENVLHALQLAAVTREDTLLDVGCGDGRVVVAAAALYGCTARGIELDEKAVAASARALAAFQAETCGRASVACADATAEGALAGATVLFCSLLPDGLAVLRPALDAAREKGARLLVLHFPLPGEEAKARDETHRLWLY